MVRSRITWPGAPAQIDDEITETPRAWLETPPGSALAEAAVTGGSEAVAVGDPAGLGASTIRRVASISPDDVPKGKRARTMPRASRSQTSAVCDIEYSPGTPVSTFA